MYYYIIFNIASIVPLFYSIIIIMAMSIKQTNLSKLCTGLGMSGRHRTEKAISSGSIACWCVANYIIEGVSGKGDKSHF